MREIKREKVTIGRIWGIIYPMLLYFGITIIVEMAMMVLIAIIGVMNGIAGEDMLAKYIYDTIIEWSLLITLVAGIVTTPILIFFYRRDIIQDKINNKYVKYKKENFVKYFLIIPFGAFNMIWANFFVSLLQMIMPDFMVQSYADIEKLIYGGSIVMQFLTAAIAAPIVEELIFRGLIYKRIKKMTGVIGAAFLSALLFGIFHGNWVQAPYAIIIGLVCVFVYEKYKSIVAPILLHMSANALSVFFSYIAGKTPAETTPINQTEYVVSLIIWIAIMGTLAMITGLIIWFTVHPKKSVTQTQQNNSGMGIHTDNNEMHMQQNNSGMSIQTDNPETQSWMNNIADNPNYTKEQNKEKDVDMETTFYYQRRDDNSKEDN